MSRISRQADFDKSRPTQGQIGHVASLPLPPLSKDRFRQHEGDSSWPIES